MTFKVWGATAIKSMAVVCVMAAGMAACGGGSGGGGDSGSVDVRLISTAAINAELLPGDRMRDVALVGQASGNLGSLNGQTVYVTIEDPAGLFEANPTVIGPFSDGRVEVQLRGRELQKAGTFSGQLAVRACLDRNCARELSGSPMRVPFSVKVLRPLEANVSTLQVQGTFGDQPQVRTVALTLPEKMVSLNATNVTPYNPYAPSVVQVSAVTGSPGDTSGSVVLSLRPAPPGLRRETITVRATVEHDLRVRVYEHSIEVTYDVADNPTVDFVLTPPEASVSIRYNNSLLTTLPASVLVRPGLTLTPSGIEYLNQPPAAVGHRASNDWLGSYWFYSAVSACYSTIDFSDCLPVGTYTARLRYTLTKGGVNQNIYYPVTMTIVP